MDNMSVIVLLILCNLMCLPASPVTDIPEQEYRNALIKLEKGFIINNFNKVHGEESKVFEKLNVDLNHCLEEKSKYEGMVELLRELVFNNYTVKHKDSIDFVNKKTPLNQYEDFKEKIMQMENKIVTLEEHLQEEKMKVGKLVTSTKTVKQIGNGLNLVYAVNCGGKVHIDENGIYYNEDKFPATTKFGTLDTWLKNEAIQRVPVTDYILYRTVRYGKDFGFGLPINAPGEYVMVLKFVNPNSDHNRKFNIILNKLHTIVERLDLYSKTTYAGAYEMYTSFSIQDGHLKYKDAISVINNGTISIQFVHQDSTQYNAVVSAIYVIKGTENDVPKLPTLHYPLYETQ